jgi:hypothetical protein
MTNGTNETNQAPALVARPTTDELLQHYMRRKPKAFIQLDGFDAPGDCYSDPETGLGLFQGETYELMAGSNVRILIDPETAREKVLEILHRLLEWVEQDENLLVWSSRLPSPSQSQGLPEVAEEPAAEEPF